MRKLEIGLAALLSLAAAACGGSSSNEPPPYAGFVQPAGTVAVTFAVNDTANKVFTAGNLQWKGSMAYDSVTRKITKDATWTGPFANLYDDGPYTAAVTSHEGPTQTANDHIWSVTVFATPPATASDTYEYGLNDGSLVLCNPLGPNCRLAATNGWIWKGSNGTFTVAAGATAAITATGITFPAFGTNDMRFVVNKNGLAAGFCSVTTTTVCSTAANCPTPETCTAATWDTTKITIKGSAWGWNEIMLLDDGLRGDVTAADNLFTFQLGQFIGVGKELPHTGLANKGDTAEFIVVFNGKEYKDPTGNALATGVTAQTLASGGAWTNATISLATNKNTVITIP